MITKSRFKKLDNKGEQVFKVTKTVEVPLLTSVRRAAGTKKIVTEGATIKGEKVRAQVLVQDKNNPKVWQPYGDAVGIKIPHEEGYFIVPIDAVTWDSDPWNDNGTETKRAFDGAEVVETAKEEIQTAIQNPDDKKYFGFSAKQLLVIAGIVFVVTKIAK